MEGWRDEARRCKRGERNEGWSVGRISCLVSFTVARCVMTVEWIIISLSFRLLRLPPSRLSPLSLYTPSLLRALSSCTSCKKARLLHALSTFSPPSPLQRHAKRNGQRVGGWLAVVVEKGPRRGARTTLHEDGKGWRGVGREIKAERSAKCSFFRAPFPPSDRCYQHARVFLRRERMIRGEREGRKREKREEREEKGRCKPREKGLGGGVRRVGYVATDRYMNKRGYV